MVSFPYLSLIQFFIICPISIELQSQFPFPQSSFFLFPVPVFPTQGEVLGPRGGTEATCSNMADGEELLIIKGNRIVLPDCTSSGSISVKNGKIVGIEKGLHTNNRTLEAKVKSFI